MTRMVRIEIPDTFLPDVLDTIVEGYIGMESTLAHKVKVMDELLYENQQLRNEVKMLKEARGAKGDDF